MATTTTNAASLPETIAKAIGNGKSKNEVMKTLVNSGINPADAQAMVDFAVKNYSSAIRAGAMAQIGSGLLLFFIGLVITAGTYSMASSGGTGGFYVISYGPMIFGVVRVVRGLFRLIFA